MVGLQHAGTGLQKRVEHLQHLGVQRAVGIQHQAGVVGRGAQLIERPSEGIAFAGSRGIAAFQASRSLLSRGWGRGIVAVVRDNGHIVQMSRIVDAEARVQSLGQRDLFVMRRNHNQDPVLGWRRWGLCILEPSPSCQGPHQVVGRDATRRQEEKNEEQDLQDHGPDQVLTLPFQRTKPSIAWYSARPRAS